MGPDPERLRLEVLEEAEKKRRSWQAPAILKPCAVVIESEGVGENRNDYGYLLALEFRGCGSGEQQALARLVDWNNRLERPLSVNEVERIVRSAFKDIALKRYGCNCELLQPYCERLGGREGCTFYASLPGRSKWDNRQNERRLAESGWLS